MQNRLIVISSRCTLFQVRWFCTALNQTHSKTVAYLFLRAPSLGLGLFLLLWLFSGWLLELLQLLRFLLRQRDDRRREAGQLCDVDSKTLIAHTWKEERAKVNQTEQLHSQLNQQLQFEYLTFWINFFQFFLALPFVPNFHYPTISFSKNCPKRPDVSAQAHFEWQ